MRAPSGTLHVIDFKTDQIVANIQPQNYWDDIRHWEIKNNIDTLEFKVFDNTENTATLMQQNLVLKEVRDGRIVPYVINNEAEKDSRDRSLIVRASGAWVQIAKDGYIMPQRIEGKTVNQFMDMALAGMKWKRGKTEYAGFHTMTIDTIIDPLTFLKKIASLFELEIQYRVEVVGSQIVGWYVDMVKKRGRDTGKEVTLGKDLVGVRRIEHSRDVCTALVGFVKGEGDTIITVEKINDGLPYITDSDAFQRWNEKGKHKFGFYSPETEEQNMTPQRLLTLMKTEFAKRVNTSVVYDVEAAAIGRVFGLSHELINEGDTIRIKDTGFTPKLYLEARAIAGDESFTDPSQDKYAFGDYREITDPNEEMRKLYNRVLASLGNKANKELLEQLERLAEEAKGTAEQAQKESKAAKDIAEETKDYMDQNLVDIIEGANPPTTGLKPNKTLWRDISNGKPGVLKIWTGTAWEPVVPDTAPLQQSIKDVKKDIETAKTELNQKVQEAQNQATGQFNEVKESLQGVSRTISNIENKQGEIDKKVTQFEQDTNGFKTSIESLTKKDNDISNKLNTVEQTVEGTKKTIADVQQTTSELKKTTTEIKEEAGKISTKLEQVEARTVGGENWLINTGPNERPQTIGMIGGALLNKVTSFVQPDEYVAIECQDHTDAFYQFHLDNTKIGDFEKGKDITISLDLQNDVHLDFILFQYINGLWSESVQKPVPAKDWRRESWTFKIDDRATGWGFRIRFSRNEASKGKRFRFKKAKLEKGSVPTDFSKSTYEMKQSVDGVTTTITAIESKGIVGTNLVYNSNFLQRDTGLPLGWTYTNSSLTNYQEPWADESRAGVIRINRTTLAETDPNNIVSAYSSQFPVTLNTEYTFSVYMKVPNIATLKAKLAFIMEYYNASGTRVQYQDVTLTAGEIADLTANKWTRIVRTLKPTTSGIVKGGMRLALFHNGDIYYRMPQVELGDRVTGWNLSTSDFSTQHGLNDLTVKTNTIKQTVDSNQQTINSLSQTQGQQGAIIQQNTSDITQLNNQIKSKVSETQMQNYVGGLGSTNMLLNTAFEKRDIDKNSGTITSRTPSFDKWIVPAGVTVDVARHHDGYNSAKIEKTGQTNPVYAGINQIIPVTSRSGVYVYSAWFYTDNKSLFEGQGGVIKMQLWNGNTALDFVQTELEPLLVNGSWVFASVNLGMPNKDVTHIRAEIWVRKNGRMWVSQPMLQQGSTPSTFMENPKDIGNYDALVGEIAKKVATADFDSKVSKMETTINQQSNRIDLKAEATDVYTKTDADGRFGSKAMVERHESSITLMSNQINSTVKKGDIISSINQTAEQITIDVSKLAINADTMVKWLTAKGIDTNVINVNGDKITIDKNGVTVKMLDFLFEDEWGTKTTVIPKRNLIADHDFSSVPKLNIGIPNYQGFGTGYGLPWKVQGNGVVIENNTFIFNYEQMVNAVRVDTYNYPETKVQNGIHPGNSYTLSAHYRTAQINGVRTTAKPRLQVCFVTPLDDVTYKIWHEIYKDFPEPSTFYGEIRKYNFTFTVPNNYNPQEHMMVVKVTAANAQVSAGRAVCVSGITLVSGNYACVYHWDRAGSERADGLQPFNRIAIGSVNNNIGPATHGQTFDIITEKDVFVNQPILTQGINLGRNRMGQAGSARFFDGGQGYGFYFMGMAGQWYKLPNV
ncbi:phage tail spike protein [Bacillus cereus group sp. BfR-BA-01489]|uniref:phage tail spike protein n=4 Tax=unclassified Bacillus cereus group TaxID=2750818 RepID=UPI001F5A3D91